jgi:hypothetical protein
VKMLLGVLVFGAAFAAGPAQARHNDWGLPLIGGALGGYALGNYLGQSERPRTTTTYVEPVPAYAPVGPSTGSIEARLRQLDQLAAGGYITPAEYKERRAEILDGL